MRSLRDIANEIFLEAIRAVDPYESVKKQLLRIRDIFGRGGYNNFFVISFGKAAHPMASSVEDFFPHELITGGVVITKYGYVIEDRRSRLSLYEAGHPLPDERGLLATEEVLELLRGAVDPKTFILCLISGGGSSLFISPMDGLTLGDKKKTTELLMMAGADIYELNTVRKHISKVKGGRFAEY
ncbi:MAG: DUF4147 domain-containing protein, partial [Nitrospirae bacterium]